MLDGGREPSNELKFKIIVRISKLAPQNIRMAKLTDKDSCYEY